MGPYDQGLEFLDILAIVSFAMQVANYRELKSQASTDDIFAELKSQDIDYFAQILKNQELILKKLSKMDGN